jgi:DNA-binding beta-propeller fold protein YncE
MRRSLALTMTAVMVSGVVAIASAPALASPHRTAGQSSAPGPQVVATGLDNPRGIAIGPDGALYVAEAGRGGDGPCVPGPFGESCYGPTGAITRVGDDGQERIVTGLSSFASPAGGQAFGPHDIAFRAQPQDDSLSRDSGRRHPGAAYVTVGACFAPNDTCGRLLKLTGHGGWRTIADFTAFEVANNPDGLHPGESDPYGLLALPGERIVADAAGNDLLSVSRAGEISVLAVFGQRTVEGPGGTPQLMDAVPTSVAVGPDGALYISELTGAPFPVGAARIYRLAAGGTPEVYADGFTNVIDIAFAPDGSLLVLEIAKNSLASGDPAGALIRVAPDGSRETLLADGLVSPTSVAVGHDGSIYISNHGQEAGVGEVLRFSPDH